MVYRSWLADVIVRAIQFAPGLVQSTSKSSVNRVTVRMNDGFELLVLVGSTSRYLDAHTPSLSISSSTRTLCGVSFPGGFRA